MIVQPNLKPQLDALQAALASEHGQSQASITDALNQLLVKHQLTQTELAGALSQILNLVQQENDASQALINGLTTVNGALDNNVTAINQYVNQQVVAAKDEILAHITSKATETQQAISTSFGNVETLINALPTGVIKRIQRGYGRGGRSISSVDLSKSILLVSAGSGWVARHSSQDNFAHALMPHMRLESNQVVYEAASNDPYASSDQQAYGSVAWQVVEFL